MGGAGLAMVRMGGSLFAVFGGYVEVTSLDAMHGLPGSASAVFCMVKGRMLCSAMQFCPTRKG
jgi:hypothetical protein